MHSSGDSNGAASSGSGADVSSKARPVQGAFGYNIQNICVSVKYIRNILLYLDL